ncbi:MAG TPA: glycoside hydrolase family 99-like domain-containing protein [Pseudobdellovibrionaceae bacterium]|nr:glycoside hydrolase family 99-like domain-containing protein [Pseudobdellovibrionaceae bacterium]
MTSYDIKPIAFYLPQYHQIKENDMWWGEGFTEWTNVKKAKPNFEEHNQPHVPLSPPTGLGYYDLRSQEVRERQAELAKQNGIFGFCYYYYWFNGKRLLETPLNEVLRTGAPDFPFCVCWANENWTRTWDGNEKSILMEQNYDNDSFKNFIQDLIPTLKDPRYIQVMGKPMLLVYRVDLIPDCRNVVKLWREEAQKQGLKDLYLCAVQFKNINPLIYGFDAAVEFPPHQFINQYTLYTQELKILNKDFKVDGVLDYKKTVHFALNKQIPNYPFYRGIIPAWDNTARRQNTPHLFIGSNPKLYGYWLSEIIRQTYENIHTHDKFIFINAWNEWGEGCHLEPDVQHGHQYLETTLNSILNTNCDARTILEMQDADIFKSEDGKTILQIIERQQRSLWAFANDLRQSNNKNINSSISFLTFFKNLLRQKSKIKTFLKKILPTGIRNYLSRKLWT